MAALEATLSDQQPDSAELQAEANARQRLISAERELQKYRSIYGDVSTASSESASLMERLQLKEHELERLHLQLKQQQEVSPRPLLRASVLTMVRLRLSHPYMLS